MTPLFIFVKIQASRLTKKDLSANLLDKTEIQIRQIFRFKQPFTCLPTLFIMEEASSFGPETGY